MAITLLTTKTPSQASNFTLRPTSHSDSTLPPILRKTLSFSQAEAQEVTQQTWGQSATSEADTVAKQLNPSPHIHPRTVWPRDQQSAHVNPSSVRRTDLPPSVRPRSSLTVALLPACPRMCSRLKFNFRKHRQKGVSVGWVSSS